MGVIEDINNMVKIAQMRLGGTMFAQRRKRALPSSGDRCTKQRARGSGGVQTAPKPVLRSTAISGIS